ncbi:DUF86 domain-containing protein [Aquibacillus halophilus]|uniref:DUF86 domain-containing protein n=1 Tax=Aquibacillus halophilus TaxID=930132 RepID=A0A6A8DU30_9BACI|nr:DUF86 domain-containing protein [Aquibacillus halophilus]MRH44722.1 DUF86 domain-containing protein [Aquibacillus halophilus]
MYFIDRNEIEKTLLYMEGLLREMEQNRFNSFLEKLSMERMAHMIIESILDVGNMMIDGFIMRDPGSFTDIIDILVDEKVLPEEESESYKEVIYLRKMLVKEYLTIDHDKILHIININYDSLDKFSNRIRGYLDDQTNVATAFSNQ